MHEVPVDPIPLDRLVALIGRERGCLLTDSIARAQTMFADRTLWHVNATDRGGGVAEMLPRLVGYGLATKVPTRWLVLDGNSEFFAITKRLHNHLHGNAGDRGPLGPNERACYEQISAANLHDMLPLISPRDVVILHDPQTAGMVDGLRASGAKVIWRSHIGADSDNDETHEGWAFLWPYIERADAFVFSRERYVPAWLDSDRTVAIIPPSIDPCADKNRDLDTDQVAALLADAGLVAGARRSGQARCGIVEEGGPPPADARLILQVSRWDRLKDMAGVLNSFVRMVTENPCDAHLMLVGPDGGGVSDDPESAEVFEECRATWCDLPEHIRRQIHVVGLPIRDIEWNALVVNALQRHSYMVVQKSLVEGFGLTVTEAMWKARPVVASRVGGIQDQIIHEHHGLLIDDPTDHAATAGAMARLLKDDGLAARLGVAARARVLDEFLDDSHLTRHVDLFDRLIR